MAKKTGRARKFNLRKVRISSEVAVGALATLDVATLAITNAVKNQMRLMSLNCSYTWVDIQQITDDGLEFGVAHGAYTSAQVEECLEAFGAIDKGDKLVQEKSNRLVRSIGTFAAITTAVGGGVAFNDGRKIKTKLNWLMIEGDTLNLWVRNLSGVIYVTGSTLNASGELWVKDGA